MRQRARERRPPRDGIRRFLQESRADVRGRRSQISSTRVVEGALDEGRHDAERDAGAELRRAELRAVEEGRRRAVGRARRDVRRRRRDDRHRDAEHRRDAGDGRVAGLQRAEDGLVVEVARRERAGVEQRRRQSPAIGPGDLRLGSRRVLRRPCRRLQELRDANLLQLFAGEAADSRAKKRE